MDEYTVVVTGANGAIGRAVAERFAEADASVVAGVHRETDRFDDRPDIETSRTDTRDEFDVEWLMKEAAGTGNIDLVVPCAVVFHGDPGEQQLAETGYEAFDNEYRTNARGVFAAVREALPHLAADARVLVPSGQVAVETQPGYGGYAVSKAAAEAVARQYAAEIEQAVGVVDPGVVESDLSGGTGRSPADVAGLFHWAATELAPEALNGERVGLADWKRATR